MEFFPITHNPASSDTSRKKLSTYHWRDAETCIIYNKLPFYIGGTDRKRRDFSCKIKFIREQPQEERFSYVMAWLACQRSDFECPAIEKKGDYVFDENFPDNIMEIFYLIPDLKDRLVLAFNFDHEIDSTTKLKQILKCLLPADRIEYMNQFSPEDNKELWFGNFFLEGTGPWNYNYACAKWHEIISLLPQEERYAFVKKNTWLKPHYVLDDIFPLLDAADCLHYIQTHSAAFASMEWLVKILSSLPMENRYQITRNIMNESEFSCHYNGSCYKVMALLPEKHRAAFFIKSQFTTKSSHADFLMDCFKSASCHDLGMLLEACRNDEAFRDKTDQFEKFLFKSESIQALNFLTDCIWSQKDPVTEHLLNLLVTVAPCATEAKESLNFPIRFMKRFSERQQNLEQLCSWQKTAIKPSYSREEIFAKTPEKEITNTSFSASVSETRPACLMFSPPAGPPAAGQNTDKQNSLMFPPEQGPGMKQQI